MTTEHSGHQHTYSTNNLACQSRRHLGTTQVSLNPKMYRHFVIEENVENLHLLVFQRYNFLRSIWSLIWSLGEGVTSAFLYHSFFIGNLYFLFIWLRFLWWILDIGIYSWMSNIFATFFFELVCVNYNFAVITPQNSHEW